ncbi:hypothetical protein [Flammeovirga sp. EKP202]|uniref:hypothetical protein n=2 Tax=unclassified Flammeovirga TaxID=2637820 RepID=UPI0005C6513C|nr:hypothetical protein [Flammeovirga sp. EKP202]MBD0399966.1 hypothetical protein [Flammeovirga sp. EKP202]
MVRLQHITFNKLSLIQKAEIVQYFSDFLTSMYKMDKKFELYNYDGAYIQVNYKDGNSMENEIESIYEIDKISQYCPAIDWKKILK